MTTSKTAGVLFTLVLASAYLGCASASTPEEVDCLDSLLDETDVADQAAGLGAKGVTFNGTTMNGTTLNGITLNGSWSNGTTLNGTTMNGTTLNGVTLNGVTLNGALFNGAIFNGAIFNGAVFNGVTLNGGAGTSSPVCHAGIRLEGTSFVLDLPDGSVLQGTDFVGVQFAGLLGNGDRLRLQVEDIQVADAPNDDLLSYRVSYQTTEGWLPLCGMDDRGQPRQAIPLSGRWSYAQGEPGAGGRIDDPRAFTFACEGFALAKCVKLGYRPWETREGVSLQDHHEACVRMLRADYCGDGRSWTEDGTLVNVYDGIGVQKDEETWVTEAEWTKDGARCVRAEGYRKHAPDCGDALVSSTCGDADHFSSGTLLMTEAPAK